MAMRAGGRTIVVGGGIAGAFAAYFLARDGFDVTLLERAGIGSQASGHNPGGINPMHGTGIPGPMQALAWESFQLHLAHWPAIEQLSGIPFSPRRPSRIHVALEDADVSGLVRLHDLHTSAKGFSARWLDRAELHAIDARLNPSAVRGLWTEGNGKVDARAFTRAVAAAAEALGASIERGNVMTIKRNGDRAEAVVTHSRTIPCDAVIVATGAWGAEGAAWFGCSVPIEPVKGELLLVKTEGPAVQHAFAWRDASVYGDGKCEVWLGGTEERAGYDSAPTVHARELILERVRDLMPGLQVESILQQTAALRPVTPDDLPVIGVAPGWSNVGLALAGGRKGMLFGAAMGRAAGQLVTGGETDLSIGPCAPARFLKSRGVTAGVGHKAYVERM